MKVKPARSLVLAAAVALSPGLVWAKDEISFSVLSHPALPVGRDVNLVLKHLNNRGWDTQSDFSHDIVVEARGAWTAQRMEFPWAVANDALFAWLERRLSDSFLGIWDGETAVSHGFDSAYLRLDQHDQVIRLGLAWVPFDNGKVRGHDECGPPDDWDGWHCIEKDGDSNFTVKMKTGHPGFDVFEIAAHAWLFEDTGRNLENDVRALKVLADNGLSETLSATWLLTAVGNGRNVVFELYRPGETEPYRTASGDSARPGERIEVDGDGGSRNTCGGRSSACPMFHTTGLDEFEALVTQVRNSDGWIPEGSVFQ